MAACTANSRRHTPAIGIFCRELNEGGDPFSNERYWQAYQDLLLALQTKGVDAYLVSDNNTYRGYGHFTEAFTTDTPGAIKDLQRVENITVDLVFDRGGFIGRDVLTINPPILTKIASSKIEMYEYFASLQPKTFIAKNKKQVEKVANKIPGDKLVVKEPEGSGGNEVYIGTKQKVLQQLPDHFPVLVQEFLDTSAGVPGQVEGVHDARLGICGGRIITYNIRRAQDGKLHANVAQGGELIHFDVTEVSAELREAATVIDGLFADQPRYYSLDFVHTAAGWKMVELNSYLGLRPAKEGREARKTMDLLSTYLVTEANKQVRASRI